MSSDDDRLNLEILGLLLQVAWANNEIQADESQRILQRARESGLGEAHIERLELCLIGESTLPPPDLGYLRKHAEATINAVEHFVGTDVGEDTDALINEVRALLNVAD